MMAGVESPLLLFDVLVGLGLDMPAPEPEPEPEVGAGTVDWEEPEMGRIGGRGTLVSLG